MRKVKILSIVTEPIITNEPQYITISGNVLNDFHGDEWVENSTGARSPFYTYNLQTNLPPYNTTLLPATTFLISENSHYAGRYTTYSKLAVDDFDPVVYDSVSNTTKIRLKQLLTEGAGTQLTDGYLTGISTYKLDVVGSNPIQLLETQTNSTASAIELFGRFNESWGESIQQNFIRIIQHFAGGTAPTNPIIGQLWYDTATNQMKVYGGAAWVAITATVSTFTHTQTTSANSWVINHNLGLAAPFIADISVFVNVGGAVKPIIPSDIVYNSANQTTIIFSSTYTGYVKIRK
jgi:hypothetical protein